MWPVVTGGARTRLPHGYEFVRVLGAGGNGWVALARHTALARLVAVKTVYGGRLDPDELRRLEREGRVLAKLAHPAIVGVHELLDVDGDLALVMEYVPGCDLSDALSRRRIEVATRLHVLDAVASALTHAAARGVVHRDVKPSNVLLGEAGEVKVADFGIARLSDSAAAFRTTDGSARGTPRYMSPEQADGTRAVTPQSDAYSYAAMAYEMLTGGPPFTGDVAAILHAHREVEPPDPRRRVPELPTAAADAILSGLEKDPARRALPGEIVRRLATVPAGDWEALERRFATAPLASRVDGGTPATGGSETGTGTGTQVAVRPDGGAPAARPLPSAPAPVEALPWVSAPQFRLGRRRGSVLRRGGSRLVVAAVAAGVLVGVVALTIVTWLRR